MYKNAPGYHYFKDVSGRLELIGKDYRVSWSKRLVRQSALGRYIFVNLGFDWRRLVNKLAGGRGAAEIDYVGNTRANFDQVRIAQSQRAVDSFFAELPRRSGLSKDRILFVLDGMRPHLYDPEKSLQAQGSYVGAMRRYFINAAFGEGYELIDMEPEFSSKHQSDGVRFEFPTDHHWNEAGHELVAQNIERSKVFGALFE